MKFNGVDPNNIHSAVSVSKEMYPSAPAMHMATVSTDQGELVAHVSVEADEATIRLNVAARSYEEAAEARLKIAKWANSNGKVAELLPTHMPGKAYGAILKSIGGMENRFGTVDVVFTLPRPVLYETMKRSASGTGESVRFTTGGTATVMPVYTAKPMQDAENFALMVDGVTVLAIAGTVTAGQTIEYNTQTGALTIDGEHAESRMRYADMEPDVELLPGVHTLAASVPASLTARWQNQWL